MSKKRVTKIDPNEKLAHYLDHRADQNRHQHHKNKVSASLNHLHSERKSALVRRLGLIIGIALVAIIGLGYYISPLADVRSVQVQGSDDLPVKEVVATSGIKASGKVCDYLLKQSVISQKLANKYTEVKNARITIQNFNHLIIHINEFKTISYIKTDNRYRKILSHGKLGTRLLPWNMVDHDKPIFVGYSHKVSLKQDLSLFNSLPDDFQEQIKLLSGNTRRKSQVIFVMKDGNVITGNISTLKDKIKYYNKIKSKVKKNSLIDLEVGVFSRPLTASEKKAYGIS
ncbi:FtsQ-type POTRA domain-containing protein [Lactobacillus sp. ESL0679]|uniref:cell division protein FtsQ/DivIB n=1 Tax=unclassified Lactobacillus TaxID=2620435 RepID=UPI0023F764EA|nr:MULTISPECIES: FtsQ-type POTRA domain-containing protein [unclassified Lactobacillus]MDF7682569.1 FtsQ-type POTRA domain-containing protein [Lactobacillus sp. ESL0679]WEV37797.1 FtsQ-type POTRA domain-containing protein [Lactobacillus sp. ESL0677]